MLIAIQIVLSRFLSIQTPFIKIGFGILPIAIAARYLGIAAAPIVGGTADLIGAILFPFGAYSPGFTLTEIIRGLILWAFLRKEPNVLKVFLGVLISEICCSVLLNSFWLYFYFDLAFLSIVPARLVESLISTVIFTAVLSLLFKKLNSVFGGQV